SFRKRKYIDWSFDQSVIPKHLYLLLTQPFNIQRGAGNEMPQPLHSLRRTDEAAGTAARHFALLAHCKAAANGTVIGKMKRPGVCPPPRARSAESRHRRAG